MERVWLYLRKHFLSLHAFKDYSAIVDARNRLMAEPGRIHSPCHQPWIKQAAS